MYSVVATNDADRSLFFNQAADSLNMASNLIEKDFWVTLILHLLFSTERLRSMFTFKGGTSLSKVYNVIDRFSEDIDISVGREHLGPGGVDDLYAMSVTKREKTLEQLNQSCIDLISKVISPTLDAALKQLLPHKCIWSLEIDQGDPLILLFTFPTSTTGWTASSFKPVVKIEFGARAESWPCMMVPVSSYLARGLPIGVMENAETLVNVLKIERTFWEKITILHSIYHGGSDRLRESQSRHYYDVYQIYKSTFFENIIQQKYLLEKVAIHKKLFFRAGWAKYEEAKFGSIRIVPEKAISLKLESDYKKMRDMFFRECPDFKKLMLELEKLEKSLNEQV